MPKIDTAEEVLNVAAPLGFDAQAIPIESICTGQVEVSKQMLQPEAIRARLAAPPAWHPEITDENRHVIAADIIARRQAAGKVTRAAVLIPLVLQQEGFVVIDTTTDADGRMSVSALPVGAVDLTAELRARVQISDK